MRKPSTGWALRRNLWVHGVDDPMAFVALAPQYTLKGREHLIRCPTFVCHTVDDDISADRPGGVPRAPLPVAGRGDRGSVDPRRGPADGGRADLTGPYRGGTVPLTNAKWSSKRTSGSSR